jgi:hypothetical protein
MDRLTVKEQSRAKENSLRVFFLLFLSLTTTAVHATTTPSARDRPKGDPPAGAVFAFGNYIVTQKALDDAPQRYTKFLEEALEKAEQTQLPDKSGGGGCGLSYDIIASQAKIDIQPDWSSLGVKIAADGFVANVTASITISNVRTTVTDCHKIL